MVKGNSHWEITTLGDICRRGGGFIQTGPFGSQLHASDYVEDGIPTIMPKNIGENKVNEDDLSRVAPNDVERLRKYKVQTGDIVYSRRGDVTLRALIREQQNGWLCGTGSLMIRLGKGIADPKFVSYYLGTSNAREWIQNHAVGATMPNLNTSIMSAAPIAHPPLPEQQKIAAVLSALDTKIELNQRINAELESMAKTLYDYWFVQFDFPNEKGKPYKSAGGKMVWNDELKREIPLGWEVKKFADWIESDKSGDWGKDEPEGNYVQKVSCIRGTDINGLNGTDNCNPPTRFILEKNSHKILNANDLIIEISGGAPTQSTGRLGFITDGALKRFGNPLICSNFCKAIVLKDKKQLYNFVYHWNMLYDNDVFFGYEGKTSGIKNLLFDSFVNSHWTVIPPSGLVDKFYDFMQTILSQKHTLLLESQTLTELRDWLLPMLMNGQVKV